MFNLLLWYVVVVFVVVLPCWFAREFYGRSLHTYFEWGLSSLSIAITIIFHYTNCNEDLRKFLALFTLSSHRCRGVLGIVVVIDSLSDRLDKSGSSVGRRRGESLVSKLALFLGSAHSSSEVDRSHPTGSGLLVLPVLLVA